MFEICLTTRAMLPCDMKNIKDDEGLRMRTLCWLLMTCAVWVDATWVEVQIHGSVLAPKPCSANASAALNA